MGWLIGLAVAGAILFLPLGFCAIYRENKFIVWLLIGPLRLRVYPESEKNKNTAKSSVSNENKDLFSGGNYDYFLPFVRTLYTFLGEFRRGICVKRLELKVILADDDPADLAVNYGRAWAALGVLIPQLERFFVIKKRNLEVECDFTAEKTMLYARIDATLTMVRTLYLLSKHTLRFSNQKALHH